MIDTTRLKSVLGAKHEKLMHFAATDPHHIVKITKEQKKEMYQTLNSATFPLACAFITTLGLSVTDCIQRQGFSPLLMAPTLLALYMMFYLDKHGATNPHALQILAMMPLIYIIATEFVLKSSTRLHVDAILWMQPPFLVLLARNCQEGGIYLLMHFILATALELPHYRQQLCSVLLNDVSLFAIVVMKVQITSVAESLLSQNSVLTECVASTGPSAMVGTQRTSPEREPILSQAAHAKRSNSAQHYVEVELGESTMERPASDGVVPRFGIPDVEPPPISELESGQPLLYPEITPHVASTSVSTQSRVGVTVDEGGPMLTAERLTQIHQEWTDGIEPPWRHIEALCTAGQTHEDVMPWLLTHWVQSELQCMQLMEQIQASDLHIADPHLVRSFADN